jgi:hypothetical protein
MKQLIYNQIRYCEDADEAVQMTLDFVRLWAMFNFPRLLRALDGIQRDVFERVGLLPGNYEFYANAVENLFLDKAIVALDEYGVPLELARKLESRLQPNNDLDSALKALKRLNVDLTDLSPFEKELIRDAQRSI